MQTLGISESTRQPEGRIKTLLWPSIHSDVDIETITRQGLWICFALALVTLVQGLLLGQGVEGLLGMIYLTTCAIGIRNLSKAAAVATLAFYLSEKTAGLLRGQNPVGIVSIIITALLIANVRAIWLAQNLAARRTEPPMLPLQATLGDYFASTLPLKVWPWMKWVFWALTTLFVFGLTMSLIEYKFGPIT